MEDVSYLKEDLAMQKIMKNHLQDSEKDCGLSLEDQEFITLAVLANLDGKEMIKNHVKVLLENNCSVELIKEALFQATPYIGLVKVNNGMDYVNQAIKEFGVDISYTDLSTTSDSSRFDDGFNVQSEIFSREAIQKNHESAPKDLKHIQNYLSAHCFGDFYTRKGLDLKQRELITFSVIASLGGCENQLRAHTQANLNVGNTRATLIYAITLLQPYIGFPRTLNAIAIINEITKGE